jgi:hypothetical protein
MRRLPNWHEHISTTNPAGYRAGKLPSGRKMLEWARRYGLEFRVTPEGMAVYRLEEPTHTPPHLFV